MNSVQFNDRNEADKNLENIFNFSPIPLLISRIDDGIIVMANESAEQILQIKKNILVGKPILEIYASQDERSQILEEIKSYGKILNREVGIRNGNHEIISCLISIEKITINGEGMYLKGFTNISERKLMEDAIHKSENNLRTVFENTEVGYILFNQFQNIISYNKPASIFALKEFNKEIHVGTNFSTYFPEIMRDYLGKILEPVLKGETTSFERYIIHNEENHWYYVKFSPVFNKNQMVEGFIMSMENITERKKNDIALNKSLELVTEQNKRLLNFSYIVSHNLRSHASNMISILNFLEKEKSEQEKASLMVHLKKVSQLLNETLFNLNEVVSIQKNLNTTIENLNLFEYINQTIAILNKEISAKDAIVENFVPANININFNPAYLESVLLNFLTNALKYTFPSRRPHIQFKTKVNQKSVDLMISDNGIGIDLKKYHDRIFGMYKTFHGNKDARGIGLFISKNQIDAMGGKVEIVSEPNIGTTFKITFI